MSVHDDLPRQNFSQRDCIGLHTSGGEYSLRGTTEEKRQTNHQHQYHMPCNAALSVSASAPSLPVCVCEFVLADSLNNLETSRLRMEYPSLIRVSPATIT